MRSIRKNVQRMCEPRNEEEKEGGKKGNSKLLDEG